MSSIKRLIVDNFQSHQHTEVEFGSGLNVVVGPSDFGKSALVRALRWVLYNEPRGANFIRVGAKVCQVKVELDDGTIVARLRSTTGKNQYLLKRPDQDELVFEGFGSDVPAEIIQVTGVRKVIIDEHRKVELNLASQLEGPFLMAENGAIRAKVIGQLGGVHILDWAQRSVNTELRRLGEQEKRSQEELEQLAESLKSYEHLPELQEKIEQITCLIKQIEKNVQKVEKLATLQRDWEENEKAIDQVEQLLSVMTRLDQAEESCQQLVEYSQQYSSLLNLQLEISQVNKQFAWVDRVITDTGLVSFIDEQLQKSDPLFHEWKDLSQIASELEQIASHLKKISFIADRTKELAAVEKQLKDVEEKRQRWKIYHDLGQDWKEHEMAYRGSCLAAERYQKEIDQHLQEFRKFLLKIGKCPVCFGELDQEAIERVLNEYS
jgi:exonuclease SbcC